MYIRSFSDKYTKRKRWQAKNSVWKAKINNPTS